MAGLYLHVPVCRRLCPYCHFLKTLPDPERVEVYLESVVREAEVALSLNLSFETLYVGGGTPSLLGEGLKKVLKSLLRVYSGSRWREISVEINPEDASEELFEDLAEVGVHRVSLGVQAADPRMLGILGREHSVEDSLEAARLARKAGIPRLNYDFIVGVQGEDEATGRSLLEFIDRVPPESLSLYLLEGMEGKGRGPVPLDGEAQVESFLRIEEELERRSYHRYEISNFARPGGEGVHNLLYWDYSPFLGLGPSASSLLPEARGKNHSSLTLWREAVLRGVLPWGERRTLSREERAREALMMGLRRVEGIDRVRFAERFGVDPTRLLPRLNGPDGERFFSVTSERLRVRRESLFLLDALLEGLF